MNPPQTEHDTFLDELADGLHRRGWRLPALVILEAGQPLAYLGGQFLWLLQPSISLIWPQTNIDELARVLENPQAVAGLAHRLAARG